jgi:hypothetical protein
MIIRAAGAQTGDNGGGTPFRLPINGRSIAVQFPCLGRMLVPLIPVVVRPPLIMAGPEPGREIPVPLRPVVRGGAGMTGAGTTGRSTGSGGGAAAGLPIGLRDGTLAVALTPDGGEGRATIDGAAGVLPIGTPIAFRGGPVIGSGGARWTGAGGFDTSGFGANSLRRRGSVRRPGGWCRSMSEGAAAPLPLSTGGAPVCARGALRAAPLSLACCADAGCAAITMPARATRTARAGRALTAPPAAHSPLANASPRPVSDARGTCSAVPGRR